MHEHDVWYSLEVTKHSETSSKLVLLQRFPILFPIYMQLEIKLLIETKLVS